MCSGGFAVYEGLLAPETEAELLREATEEMEYAQHQENWEPNADEWRGGTPERKLLTSSGGGVQDALYESESLQSFLGQLCQCCVVPSGNRGSYSYYARENDFLGLHRDIDTCDVAVICCLYDNGVPDSSGGSLILYPWRFDDPLSAIRDQPAAGALEVKLNAGQTLVILGGQVPHRIQPVHAGQVRIVSVLCFRLLEPYI